MPVLFHISFLEFRWLMNCNVMVTARSYSIGTKATDSRIENIIEEREDSNIIHQLYKKLLFFLYTKLMIPYVLGQWC